MGYGLCVLIGGLFGGALVWLVCHIKAGKIIENLRSRLAVAEEKNFRIPKLELTIGENKTQIADLGDRITTLKDDIIQKADKIATLNLQLVEQAEASKNKLTMLNDAQSRLCQALIALSETALNCNNDEFMQAMESNLSAFEESLMADISRWQGRDRATTHQVCQIADSEQITPALPHQDRALEGLISPDEPAEESAAESEAPPEQPGTSAPGDTEPPADAEDTQQEDLITQRIEADIASLEERLDEEISFEFDDTDNDDDSDATSPAATPAESPLKFEIEEVSAPPAQSQDELTLKDENEDEDEDPLKKKLNTESPPAQTRKKAV